MRLALLRDIAVTIGALGITALAVDDIVGIPPRPRPYAETGDPDDFYGALYRIGPGRDPGSATHTYVRPATLAEAVTSQHAATVDYDRGVFAVLRDGTTITPDQPAWTATLGNFDLAGYYYVGDRRIPEAAQ